MTGTKLAPTGTSIPTAGELIKTLRPGEFKTLSKVAPSGALQARRLSTGAVKLYWRYTHDSKTERIELGIYDPTLPPKQAEPAPDGRCTIEAAKRLAGRLAVEHDHHRASGGIRRIRQEEAEAQQARVKAQAESSQITLEALLEAYWEHLEKLGRPSSREAKCVLSLHCISAWPKLAKSPAQAITDEQIADMLRRLFDQGKERTANKLRAYLRAAFEVARMARSNPKTPAKFKGFNIRHNPAADTAANSDLNRADKNPLNLEELQLYWRLIEHVPGLTGAALRLHVLTGGQRIQQLVRLRWSDTHPSHIVIHDGKGRPGRGPRAQTLPLLPQAAQSLAILKREGVYTLSTDGGATHIANTTLSDWAKTAAEGHISGFQAKRVRSGIETLLASLGVSKDIRGRLQSHGIGGVQDAHYDGHDYLIEKERALQALWAALSTESPEPQSTLQIS